MLYAVTQFLPSVKYTWPRAKTGIKDLTCRGSETPGTPRSPQTFWATTWLSTRSESPDERVSAGGIGGAGRSRTLGDAQSSELARRASAIPSNTSYIPSDVLRT